MVAQKERSVEAAVEAAEMYFAGDLEAPTSVQLDLEGSPMQKRVWALLGKVRPGTTITYARLAERARHAGAFRAIGAANGANPCALFVPCHRVVSSSGALQGYGGGIEKKAWLLNHEGVRNDGRRLTAPEEEAA
jgi:methylated-DNA-[protein]-cysteine S-methyltransferase